MIPKYPDHSTQSWQEGQNLIRLLHNGIIHRNVLAQREIPVNHFLLLVRIIIRKQTLEHLRNGRLIYAQGVHHRIYIPHKNTGIPEEIIFEYSAGLFPDRVSL